MLTRVISGFQSGADIAGIKAARRFGIEVGGWAPKGWLTEDGPRPEYERPYGAKECQLGSSTAQRYRLRALQNVIDSDGTICFDAVESKATDNAYFDAEKHGKHFRGMMLERTQGDLIIACVSAHKPHNIAEWITENDIRTLNVAGNRASKSPGIEAFVIGYLSEVFRLLGFREVKEER